MKFVESEQLELKSSFQKEVIESVVAFANAKGGSVIVGVNDEGQVVGLSLGSETLKDWQNQIKNSTYPQIIPDMELICCLLITFQRLRHYKLGALKVTSPSSIISTLRQTYPRK